MSLFFYVAVEHKGDKPNQISWLTKFSYELGLSLEFDNLQKEYSFEILFGLRKEREKNFLVFEIKNEQSEIDEKLYANYGGEIMVEHYRNVVKQMRLPNWETAEFRAIQDVNEVYEATPFRLPIIKFIGEIFRHFPDREIIINFDEGFENRFDCQEITADSQKLLHEAWMTIAYGYSWPNLRLRYQPMDRIEK